MDILGDPSGHIPRHSRVYRNVASECARLRQERIAAFSEIRRDVDTGAFPEDRHILTMDPAAIAALHAGLPA